MTHNRYVGFIDEHNRGYLVAFTLHWEVIEARRVDPAAGAPRALRAFINEYEANGWLAESDAIYGFVFMNRDGRRILVEATPATLTTSRCRRSTPSSDLLACVFSSTESHGRSHTRAQIVEDAFFCTRGGSGPHLM